MLEALASYKYDLVSSPGVDSMGSTAVKRLGHFFSRVFFA